MVLSILQQLFFAAVYQPTMDLKSTDGMAAARIRGWIGGLMNWPWPIPDCRQWKCGDSQAVGIASPFRI